MPSKRRRLTSPLSSPRCVGLPLCCDVHKLATTKERAGKIHNDFPPFRFYGESIRICGGESM